MPPKYLNKDGVLYCSIQEAVEEFGYSRRTIYNWMKAGLINYMINPSGQRYIEYTSMELRENRTSRIKCIKSISRMDYLE